MASYDFECKNCKSIITLSFGMNDDKGRNNAKCPKCKKKIKRIFSVPAAIVKQGLGDMKLLPSQKFVDVDGRPVVMNFIDHGDRSGMNKDSLVASNVPGARIDEATGKPVVDVVSNIPDPLGHLERSKQKGDVQIKKKKIGQKYKVRKK